MRVSSAATASTLQLYHSHAHPHRHAQQRVERVHNDRTGTCQQRTRPHALLQRSLAPEVIGWDAPAA
eukprot:904915-Prymnesium_polylepis.1